MLIFPLKKEWYEKIKSGEKTVITRLMSGIKQMFRQAL